jgi:hypothetical protein
MLASVSDVSSKCRRWRKRNFLYERGELSASCICKRQNEGQAPQKCEAKMSSDLSIIYEKCKRCGIHESSETIVGGVCEYCRAERPQNSQSPYCASESDSPYLLFGFVELAIISTLMVAFFPWSLLFCVFFFGIYETKLIILALLHDLFKTILAVLSVVVPLVVVVVLLLVSSAQ